MVTSFKAMIVGDNAMQAADDAANAQWWDLDKVPAMAFDHDKIVRDCFLRASELPAAHEAGMHEALRSAAKRLGTT